MTEQQVEELNWPDVIESAKEKFLEIQPQGMQFTAERAFAIQHLKNNDYLMKVAKASPSSLQSAMLNVAAVGLSLNPAKKQAYLVPRKGKVCFDPSYMGLCDIATMSGSILWVQAQAVYAGDLEFIDNGPGEKPTHRYDARIPIASRGDLQLVYCVAKTGSGDYLTTIMPIDKVNEIMNRSESVKSGSFSPWRSDFLEMAKKTVVRNAFKFWPKTQSLDRMALAVQISNENEDFEPIRTAPPLAEFTPEQKAHYDYLISTNQAIEMYLFSQSIEESQWNGLYNSFEKGKITHYKRIVDGLYNEGQATLNRIAQAVDGHASRNDDAAIAEELTGLSPAALAWVSGAVSNETAEIMRVIHRESAP